MNLIKKIVPLAIFSILILAGCKGALNQPQVDIGGNGEGKMVNEVMEDTMPATEEGGGEEEVMEDTVNPRNDKQVSCNMFATKEGQENCQMQVNEFIAQELYSEIRNTFDLSRCKLLPTAYVENCETGIKATGVTGPVSDEDLEAFREALRPTYPENTEEDEGEEVTGEPTYDKAKCATLKAPGYKAYCEGRIQSRIEESLLMQIIEGENVKDCDTLTSEDRKRECKAYFGVFEEQPEEEIEEETEEVVEAGGEEAEPEPESEPEEMPEEPEV